MGDGDRAARIQQRIDENVADLPFFYGRKEKDTVTLKHYISRVDQGVAALGWTQAQAYVYFTNSIKDKAANWLEYHLEENRDIARSWEVIKPAFRRAFGDTTDQMVFASDLSSIKIEKYNNDLYDFAAAVTRICKLHNEKYQNAALVLPNGHGLDAAGQLVCRNAVLAAFNTVHDDLRKEFFIMGLNEKQKSLIHNKPELNTMSLLLEFIKREEDLISKAKTINGNGAPPPPPAATLAPIQTDDTVLAALLASGYQRGGQQPFRGQQQRGRGQRGATRGSNSGHRGGNANAGASGSGGSGNNPGHNNGNKIKFCLYCRKPYHKQENCKQRIKDNAPCLDAQGFPFYPKSGNTVQCWIGF